VRVFRLVGLVAVLNLLVKLDLLLCDPKRWICGIGVELIVFVIFVLLVIFVDLPYLPSDICAIM